MTKEEIKELEEITAQFVAIENRLFKFLNAGKNFLETYPGLAKGEAA